MILRRVRSGGQTGADEAALVAAKAFGLETGGWIAKGCRTERGSLYGLNMLQTYGLAECLEGHTEASMYRLRARKNVQDSDGTLCFDATRSKATVNADEDCRVFRKPFLVVRLRRDAREALRVGASDRQPRSVARWIIENEIRDLNVAGNRASKVPDIGDFVQRYLAETFRILKAGQVDGTNV